MTQITVQNRRLETEVKMRTMRQTEMESGARYTGDVCIVTQIIVRDRNIETELKDLDHGVRQRWRDGARC